MSVDTPKQAPELTSGELWNELLAVMDRLHSSGGCQWCGEQTHLSLVKYLLEEAHELAEAIEIGAPAQMREELGDVLLQVVFHARLAADHEQQPFTADDVVRDLIDKMVRRHPHVFAGKEVDGDLITQWDAIKHTEKQRESVLDGVPLNLSALARAQKVLGRAQRAGIEVPATAVPPTAVPPAPPTADAHVTEQQIGDALLDLVRAATAAGIDAEAALRAVTRDLADSIRESEQA